jgi:hypothetical protein
VISTRALFQAVALAVVLTRSVPVPVPLPGLTEAGLKLQAAAGGTPAVQDNDTEPVNSEWPLSAIAKSAACPAMTVLEGGGPPKSNEGKRSKVADALLRRVHNDRTVVCASEISVCFQKIRSLLWNKSRVEVILCTA